MFRRIAFAAVTATGLVSGLALTPATASAHSPEIYRHDTYSHMHRRFEVIYRHAGHWDVYGSFRDRDDAERAARRLQLRGYDAHIRRVEC